MPGLRRFNEKILCVGLKKLMIKKTKKYDLVLDFPFKDVVFLLP